MDDKRQRVRFALALLAGGLLGVLGMTLFTQPVKPETESREKADTNVPRSDESVSTVTMAGLWNVTTMEVDGVVTTPVVRKAWPTGGVAKSRYRP